MGDPDLFKRLVKDFHGHVEPKHEQESGLYHYFGCVVTILEDYRIHEDVPHPIKKHISPNPVGLNKVHRLKKPGF